jgi:hypothetical protein
VRKGRGKDGSRAAVRERSANQPTQTGKSHQGSQNSRQEGRPENEVADQETIEAEKKQGVDREDEINRRLVFGRHHRLTCASTSQNRVRADWEAENYRGMLCALLLDA